MKKSKGLVLLKHSLVYSLLLLLLFKGNSVFAGKVYAVIIGISKYQSVGISKLDYAHRDAEYFANYLKSKAGGSVPDENIVLLQNEKATFSAIYNAMYELQESCQEGDIVYFYFSGHGDKESNTVFELGYLISYNTPRTNYINNALRIEDLNNFANTLSLKKKAKVIIITDACHSGKLAGNEYRGNFLVGEQLKTVLNNEIRITSCASDQLSVEDVKWGGGRGVFSYYLLNGLTGLADEKNDGKVYVKDITKYLQTSMKNDPVLKARNQVQTPVIKGKDDFLLATVDENALSVLQNKIKAPAMRPLVLQMATLPKDAVSSFCALFETNKLEDVYDFIYLKEMPEAEIAKTILSAYPADGDEVIDVESIKSNVDALKRLNKKLVDIICKRTQEIINLYLEGDEQEMERRRYYSSIKNDYGVYAAMLEVAYKLADKKSPLANIIEIKKHYFAGVALRLQIPRCTNADSLVNLAMAEQEKALSLEQNAAYIHNEMGMLLHYKKEYAKEEASYKKAIEIAPMWALPWANLAGLALEQKNYDKGLQAVTKADSLQKNYQGTYVTAGMLYQMKKNLLQAEELFRKSIRLNSRHYLPFERLGFLYISTTRYALADSFFRQAEMRKAGFNIDYPDEEDPESPMGSSREPSYKPCAMPAVINEKDVMTWLVMGLNYLDEEKYLEAETAFKKVTHTDSRNPLAFHYLGKIMWQQKRWQEADVYLNYSIECYMEEKNFNTYCDSLKKYITNKDSCIENNFRKAYYGRQEDYFLLAETYLNWNHFSEAQDQYEKILAMDPSSTGAYYKLWSLMEQLGRHEDAELVLYRYKQSNYENGLRELNAFYKHITALLPASGEWLYKAGNFLYYEALLRPELYTGEYFENYPDTDISNYKKDVLLSDNLAGGHRQSFIIPGLDERVFYSDRVKNPKGQSIIYFLKADSLLSDTGRLAAVNEKIGNLYVSLHATGRAFPYYQKALDFSSQNSGLRLKLVNALNENYYFQDAKKQLDTLYSKGEINFGNLLLMSDYMIRSGEFDSADVRLSKAKKIDFLQKPAIDKLYEKLYFSSKKYDSALVYYTKHSQQSPHDPYIMYTIAKIKYAQNNKEESYAWLENAIKAGFDHYWVLLYDATWADERNTAKWKALTAKVEPMSLQQPNRNDIMYNR